MYLTETPGAVRPLRVSPVPACLRRLKPSLPAFAGHVGCSLRGFQKSHVTCRVGGDHTPSEEAWFAWQSVSLAAGRDAEVIWDFSNADGFEDTLSKYPPLLREAHIQTIIDHIPDCPRCQNGVALVLDGKTAKRRVCANRSGWFEIPELSVSVQSGCWRHAPAAGRSRYCRRCEPTAPHAPIPQSEIVGEQRVDNELRYKVKCDGCEAILPRSEVNPELLRAWDAGGHRAASASKSDNIRQKGNPPKHVVRATGSRLQISGHASNTDGKIIASKSDGREKGLPKTGAPKLCATPVSSTSAHPKRKRGESARGQRAKPDAGAKKQAPDAGKRHALPKKMWGQRQKNRADHGCSGSTDKVTPEGWLAHCDDAAMTCECPIDRRADQKIARKTTGGMETCVLSCGLLVDSSCL